MTKNKRKTIFNGTVGELLGYAEEHGAIRIEKVVEELNRIKGEIMSLPNRDDKIGARILMPDGGGVNKFVVTNKIEDLIKLFQRKE